MQSFGILLCDLAMRRNWHFSSFSSLWRSRGNEKEARRSAGVDRSENPERANQGREEIKERQLAFPLIPPKEERPSASEGEKKSPDIVEDAGKSRLCIICGKPSDEMICGACADKIDADAVEKKRWEEKGKP
jgi:hypothetical protein